MITNNEIIELDKIEIYDIQKDVDNLTNELSLKFEDMTKEQFIDYAILNSEQIFQKLKNIKYKMNQIDWVTTFKNLGFKEVSKDSEVYKDLDTISDVLYLDLTDECDTLYVLINSINVSFIIREDGIPSFQSLRYSVGKSALIKEQFKLIQEMFNNYLKLR
jgi:hypothetical protein